MVIDKKQIVRAQSAMSGRFKSREDRLEFLSDFFQREVLSLKDLSNIEGDELIYFLNTGKVRQDNWAFFDKNKFSAERKKLWSLLHQAQWVVPDGRHGEVPDLEKLSNFIKSPKSPVNKPLKTWNKTEWGKMIHAFTQIVKYRYK